ncbi:MAG: DegT/DnrJ/EryC1/StrS aminotransferase, partial [Candidatus Giovannonibacteria bacterium GW2011_GWA2_44_26]
MIHYFVDSPIAKYAGARTSIELGRSPPALCSRSVKKKILLNLKILLSFLDIVRRKDFMLGGAVQEIEANLADFCGAKYAFGVASGTDALILSLKACDIGPGDEVITPAVGFFSSAAAISWVNARPVFVDVDPNTFNIDVSKIEAAITPRAKALLPIHLNGKMADMDPALEIARKHGLRVIADAAQAIGSRYKDKPIGQFGD